MADSKKKLRAMSEELKAKAAHSQKEKEKREKMKVRRALISVSDKTGIVELAKALRTFQVEILSTGNTAKFLKENNIPVTNVADYTKSAEILGGRVKTLHPFIFAGILARRDNAKDLETIKKLGVEKIDLAVVNLYPFEKVKNEKKATFEEIIENIDIGGPSLIRAAAKNFKWVGVITNPKQYPSLIEELENHKGELSDKILYGLAKEAFKRTAEYDRIINEYLDERRENPENPRQIQDTGPADKIPEKITLALEKSRDLRYGENPHQKAAFFCLPGNKSGLAGAKQFQGKELSFNNYLDMNAAWEAVNIFDKPTAAVIKHTNPCGLASAETLSEAYRKALAGDPLSAFGSVVGLNRRVDEETAKELNATKFIEVIIAPGFSSEALEFFKEKGKRRVVEIPSSGGDKKNGQWDYRSLLGGFLVQDKDVIRIKSQDLKIATKRKPSKEELASLLFAWRAVKQVKSNAIVIAQGERTVGIGAGQMSRVDAVKIAIMKLREIEIGKNDSLVLASDAFFPFRDAIDEAAKIGVKAIIQPGGSKRDQDVIDACNEAHISMVFTGVRHFRHQ